MLIISKNEHQINDEIKSKEVRVIDSDGSQLGIIPIEKALEAAEEKNLDLVNVAPNGNPPVCRIMDYGKYCFEQAKREKEARKNQKIISLKEVQLTLKIDTHDFETKLNHAKRFLSNGDKVKVVVKFKGRELANTSFGTKLCERFEEGCKEFGVVDKAPKMEAKSLVMFLAPKA